MFLRWEILRGWMPAIVFAAIAVAIELLYFNYMVSRESHSPSRSSSPWQTLSSF
jgi:hypothetical protein